MTGGLAPIKLPKIRIMPKLGIKKMMISKLGQYQQQGLFKGAPKGFGQIATNKGIKGLLPKIPKF